MKKRIVTIILCMASIICLFGVSYAAKTKTNSEEMFYQYGKLDKERADAISSANPIDPKNSLTAEKNNEEESKIIAKDFVVSKDEVRILAEQMKLSGKSEAEAENDTLDLLIKKYSVYYTALNEGITVSENEVREELEANKKAFAVPSGTEDDNQYRAFLEGIGMTNDEYWESQYDTLLVYKVISLYKEKCYQEFLEKNDTTNMNKEEISEKFKAYYEEVVKSIIIEENILVK